MRRGLLRRRLWAKPSFNPPRDDCEFAPLDEDTQISDRLAYYAEMRKYVEHEDELINSRLTLSLTVHGFLFAAYGLILGKAIDFSSDLCKSASAAPMPVALLLLYGLLFVIALTGVAVGLFSRNAIIAGFNAIQHINTIVHGDGPLIVPPPGERSAVLLRWALQGAGGWLLPRITSGGAQDETTEGAYFYYHYLPILLCLVWLILGAAAIYLIVSGAVTDCGVISQSRRSLSI